MEEGRGRVRRRGQVGEGGGEMKTSGLKGGID